MTAEPRLRPGPVAAAAHPPARAAGSWTDAAGARAPPPRCPRPRPPRRRYHDLYLQVKGARYKTKRTLMETIHKQKAELQRVKVISDQADLAKSKASARRGKKSAAKAAAISA